MESTNSQQKGGNDLKSTNSLQKGAVKPMYAGESLLWFGGWAVALILSVYVLMPKLPSSFTDFERFFLAMTIPLSLIFITAIGLYWLQNGRSMQGFKLRYRMDQFKFTDVVWGVGMAAASLLGMGDFSALSTKLIAIGIIPVPKNLPLILDPGAVYNHATLDQMVGGQIEGNWMVILLYFIMLFFNIAGEELLWRGYLLPRQELVFGKKTWLIHGLFWTMFHSFKWWDMLSLLPICLIISYVAQKRKSIWPGFIAHYIVNGMGLVMFLAAVLGLF